MRRQLLAAAAAGRPGGGLPLVRDFIHDALYSSSTGYFAQRASPVGRVGGAAPLDFGALWGHEGYLQALHQLYQQQQVAWLTPSEIFSPTYGRGVAACILAQHAQRGGSEPLHIVEAGGGNGTLARDVLDHLRDAEPDVYRDCRYTSLEISEELARRQQEAVAVAGGHRGAYAVRRVDAAAPEGWGPPSRAFTYVLMCEVMDNLPHDRLVRRRGSGEWLQTHVRDSRQEVLAPLDDPLMRDCLEIVGAPPDSQLTLLQRLVQMAMAADEVRWLPTGALQLLCTMLAARPYNMLIAADFDHLPEAGGNTTDYGTYLVKPGSADIFFPVSFSSLEQLYQAAVREAAGSAATKPAAAASTRVLKSRQFFEMYADVNQTACGGGYNPLLEDFSNTSFLLASSEAAEP